MVKILPFHCHAPGFKPWLGTKIPQVTVYTHKKIKIKINDIETGKNILR